MIHKFNEDNNFTPDMSFGEFLRKKRRLLGLNQTDMGDKLGKDQGTISMWELGVTSPPIDEAAYILKRLGGELQIINVSEVGDHNLGLCPWQE